MPYSRKRKLLQGSALNTVRLILSLSISLFLPHFLVHRMSKDEYSGWVLILQISAYITFLDFGMQTAISKFVAEYDALGDRERLQRLVSSAFAILVIAGAMGMVVVVAITHFMPRIFGGMPVSLLPEARLGMLLIGLSVALPLPVSIFGTIFIGLQQYGFPTFLASISRVLSAAVLVIVVLHRGTIAQMALVMACFNLATAIGSYFGWRMLIRERAPFSLFAYSRSMIVQLLQYCGTLGIWTLSTLFITGLDTTIVGRFDYPETGAYGIAANGTNFMLLLLGNFLAPLMPAASSLGTQRTPLEMGAMVEKATRYGVLLLLLISLPLIVGGYSLLRPWVGQAYAEQAVLYLRILTAANIIRYLTYPYSLMVVAMGKQRFATLSPVVEAIINFTASVLLARRYGAIGVALGTLIGAGFGVGLHLIVSMPATQPLLAFKRLNLVLRDIARPALVAIPSLCLYRIWMKNAVLPMPVAWMALWVATTLLIGYKLGLQPIERRQLLDWMGRRAASLRS